MKVQDRIEEEMNKAVNKGMFPRFIYLNSETLKDLASEIRSERELVENGKEPPRGSFSKVGEHTVYFRIDSTLANGEIKVTEFYEQKDC